MSSTASSPRNEERGESDMDEEELLETGEVVDSDNGDFCYRIEDRIGEGR